jgi:hypothetical protein
MAMDIDAQAAAFSITHNFCRAARRGQRAAVAVSGIVADLWITGKHHDWYSFLQKSIERRMTAKKRTQRRHRTRNYSAVMPYCPISFPQRSISPRRKACC